MTSVKALLRTFRGSLHIDTNRDIKNTILLSGNARGGTTWISNIINYKNDYRYIFEPFFPKYVPLFKDFKYRQYIRPAEDSPQLLSAARKVLSGQIRNFWVDRFNRKIICRKRLIKDVRTNLLLGWLKEHFDELRIVLLFRHPFAVAQSRKKLRWMTNPEMFFNQSDLLKDFLLPFRPIIKKANNDFEKHVLGWCIESHVSLSQLINKKDVYFAFYEKFCMDPIGEANALLKWIGHVNPEISQRELNKPSEMSKAHSSITSGEDMIQRWTQYISMDEKKRGIEIIQSFGLNRLYDSDPMPKYC